MRGDRLRPMSDVPTVFMFGGQGSQHYHMARELFEQQHMFRRLLLEMDAFVRAQIGLSVVSVLYDERRSKIDPFDRIRLTHPAIVMVELALAQTLIVHDVTPDYVLGASLGSFAAAAVAGCVSVEEVLRAALAQAGAIETCCQKGGMLAVLADPGLHQSDAILRQSEIAAVNSSRHFVVACEASTMPSVEGRLRQLRVGFQRLPVSYPFHPRWMEPARDALAAHTRFGLPRQRGCPWCVAPPAGFRRRYPRIISGRWRAGRFDLTGRSHAWRREDVTGTSM